MERKHFCKCFRLNLTLYLLAYRELRRWVCPDILSPPSTRLTTPTPSCRAEVEACLEDLLVLPGWTGYCRGSTEWWSWWAGWSRTGISGRDTGSSSSGRHRPSPPPSWEDWGGLRRRMIDSPGTLRSALPCPSIPRILSSGLSRSLFWRQICFSVSQHHHYPLSDLINHQNGKSK